MLKLNSLPQSNEPSSLITRPANLNNGVTRAGSNLDDDDVSRDFVVQGSGLQDGVDETLLGRLLRLLGTLETKVIIRRQSDRKPQYSRLKLTHQNLAQNFFRTIQVRSTQLFSTVHLADSIEWAPLNTKKCSAVGESQQHGDKFQKEINLRERRESNPGQLGENRE